MKKETRKAKRTARVQANLAHYKRLGHQPPTYKDKRGRVYTRDIKGHRLIGHSITL